MSFKSTYGYSPILPFMFIGLCLGVVGFILTGVYTGDWRWLIPAFACYACVAMKR